MDNFSLPLTLERYYSFYSSDNFACLRKTRLVESYNIHIDLSASASCSSKYPCNIFMAFHVSFFFFRSYRIINTYMVTKNNAGNKRNA